MKERRTSAIYYYFFNIKFLTEKKPPKISKSRPYALYSVPPTSPPIFSTDLIMWKTLEIHCTEDFVVPFPPLVSHREWSLPCRKMKGMNEWKWTFKTIANFIGMGAPPPFSIIFKILFHNVYVVTNTYTTNFTIVITILTLLTELIIFFVTLSYLAIRTIMC